MQTRWAVLVGVCLARVAFAFQLQAVAVVAPGLAEDLALDALSIGTLIGLFTLPGLVLAVPGGVIGQRVGERRFLVCCLVAMTAGALVCGSAESYRWLWVGRLLAGTGAIGLNVVTIKIVIDWFAGKEIATAIALFLAAFPLGMALATVTLGTLATPTDWPDAFHAAAALSLAALVVLVLTYRPAPTGTAVPDRHRLTAGEVAMVSLSGLVWALFNGAFIILVSFVPLYLVSTGMAPAVAAPLVGLGLWVSILAVPLGGALVDRLGHATLSMVAGLAAWALGPLLVIPLAESVPLLAVLMAGMALIGAICSAPMVALASEALRPGARGTGMGIHYAWLYAGLALGPVIAGYASDAAGDPAAPLYTMTALAGAAMLALGLFRLLQARGLPAAVGRERA